MFFPATVTVLPSLRDRILHCALNDRMQQRPGGCKFTLDSFKAYSGPTHVCAFKSIQYPSVSAQFVSELSISSLWNCRITNDSDVQSFFVKDCELGDVHLACILWFTQQKC